MLPWEMREVLLWSECLCPLQVEALTPQVLVMRAGPRGRTASVRPQNTLPQPASGGPVCPGSPDPQGKPSPTRPLLRPTLRHQKGSWWVLTDRPQPTPSRLAQRREPLPPCGRELCHLHPGDLRAKTPCLPHGDRAHVLASILPQLDPAWPTWLYRALC